MKTNAFEELLDSVKPMSNKNLTIDDYRDEMRNVLGGSLRLYGLDEVEQANWLSEVYNNYLKLSRGWGEFRLRLVTIQYMFEIDHKYGVRRLADWRYVRDFCRLSTILERKANDIIKAEKLIDQASK